MEYDKNKVGEGSETKQSKYFPKVINELTNSLRKSREEKNHLVSKFDCLSKSEIIY
jgi:hypothetical protein